MTAAVNGAQDEMILLDNGNDRRKLLSEIALSAFSNDSGWTTNTGDITGVTAGTGLSGGGSSGGVTLNFDGSGLTDGTANVVGAEDEMIYLDNTVVKRKLLNEIRLSQFSNDSAWTANTGDITAVAAGGGMTGGGTSGAVTLTLDLKDEDNMASDSASHAASQQSVKAYVLANAGGTDSFHIFGEETDDYLSSTAAAGNANGWAFSYGNGAQNTTKSSSGVDFGIPVGCDCTLKAVYVHCGNKNSDTSTGTITFDVFKNESAESDTFSGDGSGSSGNAFLISKTDYDIDLDAGDRFNLRVTAPSGYGARVGPSRMSAYFERR
jgi:hypothetical protein